MLTEIAMSTIVEPKARHQALPPNLPPRGLTRTMAAAYTGVSPTLFDEMVKDDRMPKPKRINSRTVWDIRAIDRAFDALPDEEGRQVNSANPWDQVNPAHPRMIQ